MNGRRLPIISAVPVSERVRWFSKRSMLLHLAILIWFPGCMVAAWWQVTVALGGNVFGIVYSLEWPFFGVIGAIGWWQLVHDTPEKIQERKAKLLGLPGGGGSGTTQPERWVRRSADPRSDAELAAMALGLIPEVVREAGREPLPEPAAVPANPAPSMPSLLDLISSGPDSMPATSRAGEGSYVDPALPDGDATPSDAITPGEQAPDDTEDPELAAYNAYLLELALSGPQRKTWRTPV